MRKSLRTVVIVAAVDRPARAFPSRRPSRCRLDGNQARESVADRAVGGRHGADDGAARAAVAVPARADRPRAASVPAFRTTTIGFAASAVLPARAGEVIRPYLLARQEGLSATATFATIIIERVLDAVTCVMLLASFVLFFDPGMDRADSRLYGLVEVGGVTVGALALLRAGRDVRGRARSGGGRPLGLQARAPAAREAHAQAGGRAVEVCRGPCGRAHAEAPGAGAVVVVSAVAVDRPAASGP